MAARGRDHSRAPRVSHASRVQRVARSKHKGFLFWATSWPWVVRVGLHVGRASIIPSGSAGL